MKTRAELWTLGMILIALAGTGCEAVEGAPAHHGETETDELSGDLVVLSYNVAGLPDLIAPTAATKNNALISPLLRGYDLALIQEDWVHHQALTREIDHPHRSVPLKDAPTVLDIGDGLNRFSRKAFEPLVRHAWTACNGTLLGQSDCSSDKGFSVAETWFDAAAPPVVVVNLHMDAGDGEEDRVARARQVDQLVSYLGTHHPAQPMIVAGDTNLDTAHPEDAATLARLLDGANLADTCPAPCTGPERLDRIFVRSGQGMELVPHNWREPSEFVDTAAAPLSDHRPVAIDLLWRYAAR